jgi:hypothetical protein
VTTLRVRAVPVGAALQLTRRALALGPERFTSAGVLAIMAEWWEYGRAGAGTLGDVFGQPGGDYDHPFTFALRILETSP